MAIQKQTLPGSLDCFGAKAPRNDGKQPGLAAVGLRSSLGCAGSHRNDLVRVLHLSAARFTAFDLIDIFHAFDHAAPHGILAVKEVSIVETNEKLAVRAIGMVRAGHGNGSALMRRI